MGRTLTSVAGLALAAASAGASTIAYVTDMPVFDGLVKPPLSPTLAGPILTGNAPSHRV